MHGRDRRLIISPGEVRTPGLPNALRRRVGAAIVAAALAAMAGNGLAGPAAAGPAVLTVHARSRSAPTVLHLQPGFATVLRADHRIDAVAIGDPRLVTATAVHRGNDVYDLVLQPQVDGGATNMVVWLGELATIWQIEIGPGPRTADIVYVITSGAAAPASADARGGLPAPASSTPTVSSVVDEHASGSQAQTNGAAPQPDHAGGNGAAAPTRPLPPAARSSQDQPGRAVAPDRLSGHADRGTGQLAPGGTPGAATPTPSPAAGAGDGSTNVREATSLEASQSVGGVVGTFQTFRVADGVLIRYRITNGGQTDLTMRPGGVLVTINGRITPYGMTRDSIDRERPEIVPRGATETGVIDAPAQVPREVRLVLSLFPAGPAGPDDGMVLPVTFQTTFTGVDSLSLSPDR
jgi:hypothetical protein